MFKFFNKKEESPKDLKEASSLIKKLNAKIEDLTLRVEELEKKNWFNVQKTGVVRFNPFPGVGGEQSFTVALLDGNDTGVVITSHYLRECNRVYAKPVEKGISSYTLSKEEKEAIEKAQRS
jgi:hypothetical protein